MPKGLTQKQTQKFKPYAVALANVIYVEPTANLASTNFNLDYRLFSWANCISDVERHTQRHNAKSNVISGARCR
jgi:hypothetical protein